MPARRPVIKHDVFDQTEVRALENAYLKCRSFGHAWDDVTGNVDPHNITYLTGSRITLRCISCTTEREDIVSTTTGDLIQRIYTYPERYKLIGSEFSGMHGMKNFKVEYIRRRTDDVPTKKAKGNMRDNGRTT